jgi:hypothetical protein
MSREGRNRTGFEAAKPRFNAGLQGVTARLIWDRFLDFPSEKCAPAG